MNVSKGDIATIRLIDKISENNGRYVEVIEYLGYGTKFFWDGISFKSDRPHHVWLVRGINGPLQTAYESMAIRPFSDECLIKIAGPSIKIEETTEQEVIA